jgi:hypothetical protein
MPPTAGGIRPVCTAALALSLFAIANVLWERGLGLRAVFPPQPVLIILKIVVLIGVLLKSTGKTA